MQTLWAIFCAGAGLALLTSGCAVWASEEDEAGDEPNLYEAEISTIGIDYLSQSPVVLLRTLEGGHAVPIWIGLPEAQAIARALHGVEMPRPLTHDLTISLLDEGGMTLEEVIVHDMRDGVFYGKLLVRKSEEGALSEVDSRPSDALALALRARAVIRVSATVLESTPDFDFVPPDVAEQVVQVLGMTVVTATPELRERFDLEEEEGVVVSATSDVAEDAGIRVGDVILKVNKQEVVTPMDVLDEVLEVSTGEDIEVRIRRNGEEETLHLPNEREEGPPMDLEDPGVTI